MSKDGGPAFPLAPVGTGDPRDGMAGGSTGMTLRQWYAGQALAGFCANSSFDPGCPTSRLAKWAWEQADAMLAAEQSDDLGK